MKPKKKGLLLLVLVLGVIGTTFIKAQETIPAQVVPKLLKLPIIDGEISEDEYGGVFSPHHPFSSPVTLEDDDVYIAHDGESLYIVWDAKASIANASTFYASIQIVPSKIKDVCMPEGSDIKKIDVTENSVTIGDGFGSKGPTGQILYQEDVQVNGDVEVGRSTGHAIIEIKIPLVSDPQNEDITMVSGVSYGIAFAYLTESIHGYHGTGTGGVAADYLLFNLESRADFPFYEILLVLGSASLGFAAFIVLVRREWKIYPK